MTALVVLLTVGAVYRLTMLAVADELGEPAREDFIDWLDRNDHPKLATLLGCPWCASIWIGAPVAWSADVWGDERWWLIAALALTASAATGIVATFAKPGEG